MKRLFFLLVAGTASLFSEHVFAAASDTNTNPYSWILGGVNSNKLRSGDISFGDIPRIINYATNFILGFAATVAVIMIIYGAFQMGLFGLTSQEKKKGAETIQHGIVGFVIAVSAWFIVNAVISNL